MEKTKIPPAPLFLLYIATTKVGYVLSAALERTAFTAEDAVVLNQIHLLEPVTPSTLAERLGVSPSTLSYRLRTLEERRLVLRSANPDDGRSALLGLSALGRRRWERALPAWLGALRAIEDGLDVSQADVVAALRAVMAAADRVLADQSSRAATRASQP